MSSPISDPTSCGAEVSYLLIDYVEMCRLLGPLSYRDFCAGYRFRSTRPKNTPAATVPHDEDTSLHVFSRRSAN